MYIGLNARDAMTPKGQKVAGASIFACFFFCLYSSVAKLLLRWVTDNTLVYSTKEKNLGTTFDEGRYFSHINVTR